MEIKITPLVSTPRLGGALLAMAERLNSRAARMERGIAGPGLL
jgi:hypothetical protein